MNPTAPDSIPAPGRARSSLLTSAVISSRFIPVWIAIVLLLLLILAIAPETLSATSLTLVLPLTSFLAIAALGEMLVIMTGGIDLSVPGVMTLSAMIIVGVGSGSDDRLALAILAALGAAALIGLVNGILVGVLRLNALIITLAVGQVVRGATIAYAASVANEASVPERLSAWVSSPNGFLQISSIFWVGIIVTLLIFAFLRYTKFGRRFQSVGANPHAAWIAGIRVNGYVIFAYVAAGVLYGLGGILLSGFIRSPTLGLGAPYLLGPIAAVVIGGASLTGGLASATSTWAAAFFLVLLSQLLRVLGLPTALQFVVFGAAIIGGMVVSGDRIITVVEHLFQGTAAGSEADETPQVGNPAPGSRQAPEGNDADPPETPGAEPRLDR